MRRYRRFLIIVVATAAFVLGATAVASAHGRSHNHDRQAERVRYRDHRTSTTQRPVTTTTARPTTTTSRASTTTTTASSQWQLEFSEDFTTDADEGQFLAKYPDLGAYATGWSDTSGHGRYRQDNLSAAGGQMLIHCTTKAGYPGCAVPFPKAPDGSGMLDQTYGRMDITLHADPVYGYKIANLWWSAADNWNDGEIDFPEGSLDGRAEAFNHFPGNPTSQDGFSTSAKLTDTHTYRTDWTPSAVTFYVDGVQVGRSTKVPTKAMHPAIQVETDTGTEIPRASDDGFVYVDNVTVYSYSS